MAGGKATQDYLPALNSMASLHLARGEDGAVREVVERALAVAPEDADAVLNSAALMWDSDFCRRPPQLRDAAPAASLLQRTLQLDPSHVGAHCFQAVWLLHAQNDAHKALVHACIHT